MTGSQTKCAPKAWGGGERLKVEEMTWAKEAGDSTEAKSMWDRGCEDVREACIEDADTITAWDFFDCDVALDTTVAGI